MFTGNGDMSLGNINDSGHDVLNDANNNVVNHQIGGAQAMFNNGDFVIKAPNMVHGHDTFTNGVHTTHTEHNVLGGTNVYHGSKLDEITVSNESGGVDVYDGAMHHLGEYVPNVHGGEDYLNLSGNGEAIMKYSDPLSHSSEYRLNPFNVNKY